MTGSGKPLFSLTVFSLKLCFLHRLQHNYHQFLSKRYTNVAKHTISSDHKKKPQLTPKKEGNAYIIDSNAAESIAQYVSEGWKNGLILEANPGPGKLSKHLLKKGLKILRVFEKKEEFLPELRALKSAHSNLDIVEDDLFCLPLYEAKSLNEPQLLETFFVDIQEQGWTDGIPLRVFSTVTNQRGIKFLRFLLAALPKRSSLFTFGRCQFFFLTTEREFKYMTAVPKENFAMYRGTTVLYNLFFDVKLLEKGGNDCKSVYLVQLTPKPDIFSNKVNQNRLPELYFFVRHHFIKRKALVIPSLEEWVPHCGPRLIKEGMNVFTKFGDLSPYQILLLFNQFSTFPEYSESAFANSAIRYLGREHFTYEDKKEPEILD